MTTQCPHGQEKWNRQKHLRQRKSSDSQESYNTPTEHTAGNLPNQNKNPLAGKRESLGVCFKDVLEQL